MVFRQPQAQALHQREDSACPLVGILGRWLAGAVSRQHLSQVGDGGGQDAGRFVEQFPQLVAAGSHKAALVLGRFPPRGEPAGHRRPHEARNDDGDHADDKGRVTCPPVRRFASGGVGRRKKREHGTSMAKLADSEPVLYGVDVRGGPAQSSTQATVTPYSASTSSMSSPRPGVLGRRGYSTNSWTHSCPTLPTSGDSR